MRLSEIAALIEAASDFPLVSISARGGIVTAAMGTIMADGQECVSGLAISDEELRDARYPGQIVQARAEEASAKLDVFLVTTAR